MSPSAELHLGVALDGAGWHPAAWREPDARPADLLSGAYVAEVAGIAERGHLDFLSIEDSFDRPRNPYLPSDRDATDQVRARIDANLAAAFAAPRTSHIGLIPTVTTTHTEPFHVANAIATLDYNSHGRAGWQVKVSSSREESEHFGRRDIPGLDKTDRDALAEGTLPPFVHDLFDEAGDAVEVARQLWDSWEDDAEIRDVISRRFIDRDKLHHINYTGRFFSVRGPAITPRPPQGHPVVAALAHIDVAYELAARSADLVFLTPTDANAAEVIESVESAADRVGRSGERLRYFADVVVFLDTEQETGPERKARLDEVSGRPLVSDAHVFAGSATELADLINSWKSAGFDGARLRPGVVADDLTQIVSALAPELARRGVFRTEYPTTSLRGLLGLPTEVPNRFATQA